MSESLAEYYAFTCSRKKYGKENIGRFTKYDMDDYLQSRSSISEPEKPGLGLIIVMRDSVSKGGIILYGLHWLVGEEIVSRGIQITLRNIKIKQIIYNHFASSCRIRKSNSSGICLLFRRFI